MSRYHGTKHKPYSEDLNPTETEALEEKQCAEWLDAYWSGEEHKSKQMSTFEWPEDIPAKVLNKMKMQMSKQWRKEVNIANVKRTHSENLCSYHHRAFLIT
jgi:hypothetical protein